MSWTPKEILAVVELIIYAAVTPITIYTFYKHRTPSILGHLYLFAFVTFRMVSYGLTISHRSDPLSTNATGTIINSIGVSPLLLATAGLPDEARSYIFDYAHDQRAKGVGRVTEIVFHMLVVGGIVLLAIGSSKSATATIASGVNKYRALSYAASIPLLSSWVLICVWAVLKFRLSNQQKKTSVYNRSSRLLLTEILISLPFVGVRVLYSVVYTFDHSPDLSPATSTFVVALLLVFLAQLIAASILVLGLIFTRNIGSSECAQLGTDVGDNSGGVRAGNVKSRW